MEKILLVGLAAVCLGLFPACSSDSSGGGATPPAPKPCNEDPWSCPEGQTCWITSQTGGYKCLNSDNTQQKGSACKNYIGQPTCPDDMTCFQLVGQTNAVCMPFCDKSDLSKGCGAGEVCSTLKIGEELINVCSPPKTPADAGPDTAAPDAEADAPDDATQPDDAGEEPAEDTASPDVNDDVIPPDDASAE